ncbi:DMT family transporter [Amylibacter sp. SFDW26]|uniref:DMT family transporter n=1 Tax=Amylibacter sp. SFDW26 TaxID=2652722 RepID=UPI0012616084|nr:DMT family transporter [Amylibacter sp. SFDW26]KAB7615266.1 DMT family transporter [Amylibacter sp. SFDW26]
MTQNQHPKNSALLSAGLILLASAILAGINILAKALGQDYLGPAMQPFQISFGRFTFALMALVITAMAIRPVFTKPNLKLHISRTSAGWAGVTLMFASVSLIPLPDATAISFLNPVFAMMLAIPFLGERVGKYRWLAAVIALIGAFILLRPSPATFQPAALIALAAAIMLGTELILMKRLTRKETGFQILIINNTIGFLISAAIAFFVWQAPTQLQWCAMVAIGFLMVCAQTCYITALRLSDASFIAPFSYAALIFATLYDFIIFGQTPDIVSVIGSITICSGAILLASREARAASQKTV